MMNEFFKLVGLEVPVAVLETVGKVVETIGELTDSETIQSVGQFLQENADIISS